MGNNMIIKYTGKNMYAVCIGGRYVLPDETIGHPGSGADIILSPGDIEKLSTRGDFEIIDSGTMPSYDDSEEVS